MKIDGAFEEGDNYAEAIDLDSFRLRNASHAIVLPMAKSVILKRDKTKTDRIRAKNSLMMLDPYTKHQLKKLRQRI